MSEHKIKGYKAIIILQSPGFLLGGTKRHESIVFRTEAEAEAFADQSREVNLSRPGFEDAVIVTLVQKVQS